MNEILAGIYGTHGHEKVASETGQRISNLSDLALALVTENVEEGTEIEKVASVHGQVLEELSYFDLAGRAAAHAEFTEMEKAAADGDAAALEAFFGDVEEQKTDSQLLKEQIAQELLRRQQG